MTPLILQYFLFPGNNRFVDFIGLDWTGWIMFRNYVSVLWWGGCSWMACSWTSWNLGLEPFHSLLWHHPADADWLVPCCTWLVQHIFTECCVLQKVLYRAAVSSPRRSDNPHVLPLVCLSVLLESVSWTVFFFVDDSSHNECGKLKWNVSLHVAALYL